MDFPLMQISVMMHEIVGNYRLFCIRIGDIFGSIRYNCQEQGLAFSERRHIRGVNNAKK